MDDYEPAIKSWILDESADTKLDNPKYIYFGRNGEFCPSLSDTIHRVRLWEHKLCEIIEFFGYSCEFQVILLIQKLPSLEMDLRGVYSVRSLITSTH